ncbi:hypothetical protein [Bacillus thuringiensis]|uniref:hypothetical protein n=1 Tax=Bacillus thuringiensis TaxID=1428 RepID=UPI003A8995A7
MGLDFNHSSAHWGYSGFNNFRRKLAREIDLDLDAMVGFGGVFSWDLVEDDIKDFLDHSDCEGDLTPEQCEIIYPRLLELVESWDDNDRDKQNAIILADDMKYCCENNLTLEFI